MSEARVYSVSVSAGQVELDCWFIQFYIPLENATLLIEVSVEVNSIAGVWVMNISAKTFILCLGYC